MKKCNENRILACIVILPLLIIIVISIVYVWGICRFNIGNETNENLVIESVKIKIIISTLDELYRSSGIIFPSFNNYELSAYYPYNEDYSVKNSFPNKDMKKNHIFINIIDVNKYIRGWNIFIIRNNHTIYKSNLPCSCSMSTDEALILKMKFYLSGQSNIVDTINRTRTNIDYNSKLLFGSKYFKKNFTYKMIPACSFKRDLPINNHELSNYIDWIRTTENTKELTDGYGNTIILKIVNKNNRKI